MYDSATAANKIEHFPFFFVALRYADCANSCVHLIFTQIN